MHILNVIPKRWMVALPIQTHHQLPIKLNVKLENMLKEEEYINEALTQIEPLIMSVDTEKQFQNATHCYSCKRLFTENSKK